MRPVYREMAGLIITTYAVLVGPNAIIHGCESWNAARESREAHCVDASRSQRWADYSAYHLERLTDARILIPFSAFDRPEIPRRIDLGHAGSIVL
jgi:hypothetical protein